MIKQMNNIINISEEKQMSDHMLTGAVLAMVGGFLDAYTYICRGHVFANAQTGNMVLFGIALSKGDVQNTISYLIPVIAFAMGIVIANIIKMIFKKKDSTYELDGNYSRAIHWRQIILLIEIIFLFVVAAIPCGKMDSVANVIVSFVCSLQVESFRKVNGYAYATTMCTGNLRSGTEQLIGYFTTRDKSKLKGGMHYYGIIAFFIVGAILGTIFTGMFSVKAVAIANVGLIVASLLMLRRSKQ